MKIDIARLSADGEQFEGAEPPSVLDLPVEEVRAEEPLHYCLHAQLVSDDLIVSGTLTARVLLRCSRCACFFPFEVRDDRLMSVTEVGETVEYVDLTPEIRESIILAFPSYPVCDATCKGLCAQCGVNLNEGSCSCKPPQDTRWDALENLGI